MTADNATNMDKMSEHLERKVPSYSSVNRTWCFNHILNLTGKALLKQFDIKKKGDNDNNDDANQVLSVEEEKLLDLAEGIEMEELAMAQQMDIENEDDDALVDNDVDELEEWIDEVSNEMSEEEQQILTANILSVSCVLVKVFYHTHLCTLLKKAQLRKLAFALVNSTTLLLPAWKLCLEELKLVIRIMPRDVTTRWNSTYDMLSFAVKYKKAIAYVTSDIKNNLRKYELTDTEWQIVDELKDTLKMILHFVGSLFSLTVTRWL